MSDSPKASSKVELYFEDSAALITIRASGLITMGRGRFGIIILTAAAANANIDVYDGVDSSGDLLFSLDALANYSQVIDFHYSVKFQRGIYVVVTGANAAVTVTYIPTF